MLNTTKNDKMLCGNWIGGGRQVFALLELIPADDIIEFRVSLPSEDKYCLKPFRTDIDVDAGKVCFLVYGISFYLTLKIIEGQKMLKGTAVIRGSYGDVYEEKILLRKTNNTRQFYIKPIDRLALLKIMKDYLYEKKIVKYSYVTANNRQFEKLRKDFKIDFGECSNDIECVHKILSHLTLRIHHDGRVILPKNHDALELIHYAKMKNEKYMRLNCRGLAIVFTELCLAYGFYARSITCVQQEQQFLDCHVMSIVYIDSLNKWILVDPSYNLLIKDINGVPLNIEELREKIIVGEKFFPSHDALYYGKPLDFELYIKKLVKKMIRFFSPVSMYPGYDTDMNEIELLPLLLYKERSDSTSNPEVFWNS